MASLSSIGRGPPGGGELRLPKTVKVKDKRPADRQITAEQILREAKEIRLEDDIRAPKTVITDPQELAEYRLRKRKEFEDALRRVGRWQSGVWVKYAQWEEGQKDFRRARSVWERALDNDYRNVTVWLKYAEMEMRHRFVNHARNVWDRAVTLLPRVDQLWYKYVHMEEVLGAVAGARAVFERWMKFEPDHAGWMAYIKFELRYDEVDRARAIFERYVEVLPSVKAWVRYAKFEMKHGANVGRARQCYERALEALGEDANTEELFGAFAEFEEHVKEPERARAIYRYALDHLPRGAAQALYARFVAFEKQHGDRAGIEDVVLAKRRLAYEQEVAANPLGYDAWFDYARLEEGAGDPDRVRELYERAVANVPPGLEKRYWRRYVYLWVKYAVWEELEGGGADRAREVYRAALKLVPHASFTFAKLWLLAAKLEIRARRLDAARRILGTAIGMAPKHKLFRSYIELEMQLGNVDRCRALYEKYVEWAPESAAAWLKFADVEAQLGEDERARALYELGVGQPLLDAPEALWKAYIDFEIARGDRARVRALYERLLDRAKHVKVWLSYARFEADPLPPPLERDDDEDEGEGEGDEEGSEERRAAERAAREEHEGDGAAACAARAARARAVYERAFRSLREGQPDAKEEAVMLLEAWRAFEAAGAAYRPAGDVDAAVAAVEKKMPRRVKRKRPAADAAALGGRSGGATPMEEYYDYVFPEEAGGGGALKLLEAAERWKRAKLEGGGG